MFEQDALKAYAEAHFDEAIQLLKTLGQIPAPSHKEDQRASFCQEWLKKQGAGNVRIDKAKNVICTIEGKEPGPVIVVMAHTDVVFPDESRLPLREEDGRLYAPGIGDDTANLVNLLMGAKYLLEQGNRPGPTLLLVANSCEEGLGNLKGSRQILEDYGSRIREWISFDGYLGKCTNRAVGSYRYRVGVSVKGGHSYNDFGRENAIAILAEIIHDLYRIELPAKEKTTCNVGTVEGGTTVNSIAQRASMLYEFRSASQECLEEMKGKFEAVIGKWREQGHEISVEVLGIRPGNGPVDKQRLDALTRANVEVIQSCTREPVAMRTGSTDANIPLSVGIPANTFGTVQGDLAHTREEWIEIESMRAGMMIVLQTLGRYCE